MYHVVFKTTNKSETPGVTTFSSFQNKEHFNDWRINGLQQTEEVIDEGVTQERAVELCSTPQATSAAVISEVRELLKLLPSF